jgi:hypothetical protein
MVIPISFIKGLSGPALIAERRIVRYTARVLAVAMLVFSGSSCFEGHPLGRKGVNKNHVIQHLIERAFGAFVVERTHLDPGSEAANGMPADRFGWSMERHDPLFSTCHDMPPSVLI